MVPVPMADGVRVKVCAAELVEKVSVVAERLPDRPDVWIVIVPL